MIKQSLLFTAAVFLLIVNKANGQNDSANNKLFRFSSVSIAFGTNYNQSVPADQQTYREIAPRSKNAEINVNQLYYHSSRLTSDEYIAFLFGFNRLNKKTKQYYVQRENRIGLRFQHENILPVYYSKFSSRHFDTLISDGKTYLDVDVDSSRIVSYVVNRSKILVDLGTIFESSRDKLLSLYVGYNIGVGVSLSTNVSSEYRVRWQIRESNQEISSNYDDTKNEEITLRNNLTGSSAVIWGVNFRLAKTKKFWSHCVINLETRLGAASENINNYGPYSRFTLGSQFTLKALL